MNYKPFFAGMIFFFALIVVGSIGAVIVETYFVQKVQSGQAISIDSVEYRCGVSE